MDFCDELIKLMNSISYGYLDKDYNKCTDFDKFSENYILQSPSEIEISKIGVCWDQVEYERNYFETKKIDVETYFIAYYNGKECPTHTFLLFKSEYKYIWFENSWEIYRGIHVYDTKKELLEDVKHKFIIFEGINPTDYMNLCIYKYDKPTYGCDCLSFYKHCEKGENIKVKSKFGNPL